MLKTNTKPKHVVLIISGSGQIDRDRNTLSAGIMHDRLKKLAEVFTFEGFITLRYDKRGVGKSVNNNLSTETLRFEQYIKDTEARINYLHKNYEKITVLDHGQGALTAVNAIRSAQVDQVISLEGLSEDAHTTIKRQLLSQPKFVIDQEFPMLDSLKAGLYVNNVPDYLMSLLNH